MANHSYVILFFLYTLFNIGRYFLIGQFTADVNSNNANDVVKFQQYACACYFVSKEPQKYGINTDVRFDVAHAIPSCTSCYYCENYFHGSANASFNTTGLCPVGNYKDNVEQFSFGSLNQWNHVTDCSRKISLSAMIFWTKDYNVYKGWALGVSILYCILLLISAIIIAIYWYKMCKGKHNSDNRWQLIINDSGNDDVDQLEPNGKSLTKKIDYVFKMIYLYNVLISEILLYLLYKPLQYHHKHLTVGADNKPIVCDISSIPMKTEDWLGMMAFASFIAIACMITCSVFFKSILCKCFKVMCYAHYLKMKLISTRLSSATEECAKKCYFSKRISCKHFFMVTKIIFLALAITTFVMLYKGVSKTKTDESHKVIAALILLPLSFVDNPWLWKTCFGTCSDWNFNKLRRKMTSISDNELSLTINNIGRQNIDEELYENKIDDNYDNTKSISSKIMTILKQTMKQHSDNIVTTFTTETSDNNASVANNNTQQNNEDEKETDDSNNNNNNNNSNNRFNGNSGDDGKRNNNNNNQNHRNNSDDGEDEEKEIDRFFKLLSQLKNIDDHTLSVELKSFSPNIFAKWSQGIHDFNAQMKRISCLQHSSIPVMEHVTTNGYSTDEMVISKCSSVSASDTDCGYSKVKKNRPKRKRKSVKKKKLLTGKQYEYEQKTSNDYMPNIEYEQRVKTYVLSKKWYDSKIIKNVFLYGVSESNDRVTLSVENSKFMRRCARFVKKLKNMNEFNLIPINMRDNDNNLDLQYLLVVTIDDCKHIDIGVSFTCTEKFNKTGIIVTGFHLDPKFIELSSPNEFTQFNKTLNNFKIDNLNIYGQTPEYYKNKYNELKCFLRKFIKTESHTFDFNFWIKQAQNLMRKM